MGILHDTTTPAALLGHGPFQKPKRCAVTQAGSQAAPAHAPPAGAGPLAARGRGGRRGEGSAGPARPRVTGPGLWAAGEGRPLSCSPARVPRAEASLGVSGVAWEREQSWQEDVPGAAQPPCPLLARSPGSSSSGPPQQQVESRLGELLKCRPPAPQAAPPPPPPGPWPPASPGPRLVFNRVNGRRPLATPPSLEVPQETYTLAHEENVRFVSEDFVPLDLDEWWAQQFLARITNCS
ncbi:collagen, type I, alpha 1a-like isoform X2 [Dipodomys merriami]|uniref:collagen, type I, alpha 1a-like isoform X2 n=1 Tax=Dipodomys merriami TaxID=94247 RepID=UPI003855B4DE